MRPSAVLRRLSVFCLLSSALAQAQTPAGLDFFEQRIRPLLAEKCYPCHSAKTISSGGLRLDTREAIRKGGNHGPAVVPERVDASLILRAVSYQDATLRMPPTGPLTGPQISDLNRWIEMGAPDPRTEAPAPSVGPARNFWAFQPFRAHPLPPVHDKKWPSSWIDSFLLATLEARKLKPAPPADKRSLIRRVTFDLIGLPPAPAEVEAFLADRSPQAFEKVVDRLLASPHYGERWARHWLDLARYAETDGHEFDREKPNAWRYRDYVIRAFNEDLPYDRFIREQIAGDLLPGRRMVPEGTHWDSPLGTGWFGLGEERNAADDLAEVRADKLDNQIDTLAKTFLGLTVACARCHDHKFDPISTRDYYALAGILDSKQVIQTCLDAPSRVREAERVQGQLDGINRQIEKLLEPKRLGLISRSLTPPFPPEADKEPDHLFYPLARLAKADPHDFADLLLDIRRELAEWSEKSGQDRGDLVLADFARGDYDGWRVEGPAFGAGPSAWAPPQQALAGYQGRPLANSFAGGANELVGFLTSRSFRAARRYLHVRLAGSADSTSIRQPGLLRVALVGDGRDVAVTPDGSGRFVWKTAGLGKMEGETAFVEIVDRTRTGYLAVDKIVLSNSKDPPWLGRAPNQRLVKMLDDPNLVSLNRLTEGYRRLFEQAAGETRPDADARWIRQAMLGAASLEQAPLELSASEKTQLQALQKQRSDLASRLPDPVFGLLGVEDLPHNLRLHKGGSHRNLGEEVPRGFLPVLSGARPAAYDQGSGRLQLADALADPANPLTARVLVNRVWKHHFGEGLVRTPDNFGRTGERPSHPELLDTLAARFVESGWSIKKLHRTLVLSSAYRMSSQASSLAAAADPDNRLLHRMPVRRLEAEAIRDAVLAVTGSLDRAAYGPSVPPHISEYQDGRGKPESGPLDGAGRRSIYIGVRRNFLPPLFLAFDYPMSVATIGRRGSSTVPSQALILMNSEFVAKQAAGWADRMLGGFPQPQQRIQQMFLAAFGRPAGEAEAAQAAGFVDHQARRHGQGAEAVFRAWTDLAHVLLNAKEFIFIR